MPFSGKGDALPLVFNTRDEAMHTRLKKPIAPLFSMSNILRLEKQVDEVLDILLQQFDQRFAGRGVVFDLGLWLQFFAFEVMGTMTFSHRYGFLEKGSDRLGLLESIWEFLKTAAPVSSAIFHFNTIKPVCVFA
jgi:cytochrome P450